MDNGQGGPGATAQLRGIVRPELGTPCATLGEPMAAGKRRWTTAAALAFAASASLACDAESLLPEDVAERDARAVAHGAGTLDTSPRFAHLGALFALNATADITDADALRRDAVRIVRDRLAITFALVGCAADIDSDQERTLSLRLEGCRLLLWDLDADLEGTVRVETSSCEAGECPTAVVWDLDITDIASGLLDFPKVRFSGPAEVRAPVTMGEAMQWQTFPGFVTQTRIGLRFDTLSTASWIRDENDCITLDVGARLSLESLDNELDERIGDVVLATRGLQRCPGRCAHAGQVQLTFGAGQVLGWTYEGAGRVRVRGPQGREVEVQLPCAAEMDEGAASG